jgi:hypothetical protein
MSPDKPFKMRKYFLPYLAAALSLLSQPVFAQTDGDTAAIGLAGDNLDLYAVLDLFQKSKTIESFEQSLNEEKTGINNLDLDLDKKVDFIKVVTKKSEKKGDSSYTFILQVAVTEKETQDIGVILLEKKKGKVTLQMVGDEELYGKDYVIEPKTTTPSVTSNPGYKGPDPVVVNVPAQTVVVVESAPIVQYVYSPAYVPYVPPYYYGFYPPYFAAFTVMAVGIYRSNNYYHHGGYHGGHYGGNNNININNNNNFNNYNNNKMRSNTVSDNRARGSYGNGSTSDRAGSRNSVNAGPAGGASNRAGASTRPSAGTSNRPSTGGGASASTRPSTGTSNRGSSGSSYSRPSTSNSSMGSSGRTRSSSSGMSGGGMSGGGMRGGGGGGGRRR